MEGGRDMWRLGEYALIETILSLFYSHPVSRNYLGIVLVRVWVTLRGGIGGQRLMP